MPNPTIERPLSTHELGFIDLSSNSRQQVVTGTMFLQGTASLDLLRLSLDDFVEKNEQFQCYISADTEPRWISHTEFDLENHLETIDLREGDKDSVLTLAANQAASGLTDGLPPWRISLVRYTDRNDQQPRTALLITAHHSLLDGLQGLKLVDHLTLQRRKGRKSPIDHHGTTPTSRNSRIATLFALGRDCLRIPPKALRVMRRLQTPQRQSFSITIPREGLDHRRKNLNCGFQELILGILGDALSRYSFECNKIRKVRALLPVGRPEAASETFTSNRHDVGFIELSSPDDASTGALQSAVSRIRKQIARIRSEQSDGVFSTILTIGSRLPSVARKYFFSLYANQADILISLIPAGRKLRNLQSSTVSSVFAQPALPPGHGLSVGIVTYADNVTLALQFDPNVFREPKRLVRLIEQKANEWNPHGYTSLIPQSSGIV